MPRPDTHQWAEGLRPRQVRFVLEYLIDLNGTQAVIRAGYSRQGADVQAVRLLGNVRIQRAIQAAMLARQTRTEITADRVLQEIALLAFEPLPNITELYDAHDRLKPFAEMTPAQQRMIQSVETVRKNVAAGDNKTDVVLKIRVWDVRPSKGRMVELAAKHLGLVNKDPAIDERPQVPAFALPPETPGVSVH